MRENRPYGSEGVAKAIPTLVHDARDPAWRDVT